MKVLLVYPLPTQESPQKTPPLSILYLGAYVARRGHEVAYYDERWDTDFEDKLAWAEVVGVSSMSGFQLGRALDFLKRSHVAGKVTIMGGVHCTLAPDTCIDEPYIDYLVIGEGEATLAALLDDLPNARLIPGVRAKGQPYVGHAPCMEPEQIESPIDTQTLPYFKLAAQSEDVMLPASRGCPNQCGFCYNAARPGGHWRAIPIERWVEDLDYLRSHGVSIPFLQVGDDWLGNRQRIFAIGEILADRGIQWHPSLRADQVDEVLASRLSELNCVGVSIGAESGSDDILKLMNKRIKVRDTLQAALLLSKHGIKPLYYMILGVPTETDAQREDTMRLADLLHTIHRGNCSIAFFGFDPLVGTPLYTLADSLGLSVPRTLEECCTRERSNTPSALLNAIYYIAGLTFHRTPGDKTDKNFPGIKRLLIWPFETICVARWRRRWFTHFDFEQRAIKWLLRYAGQKA